MQTPLAPFNTLQISAEVQRTSAPFNTLQISAEVQRTSAPFPETTRKLQTPLASFRMTPQKDADPPRIFFNIQPSTLPLNLNPSQAASVVACEASGFLIPSRQVAAAWPLSELPGM